jgi:hypothetical protein
MVHQISNEEIRPKEQHDEGSLINPGGRRIRSKFTTVPVDTNHSLAYQSLYAHVVRPSRFQCAHIQFR